MDPALVPSAAPVSTTFEDGLGERHTVLDRGRNETVDMLCLRGELTAVPSFEFALRERVSSLAAFRHPCYGRVRSVERLKDPASTLALVSDATPGVRLSDLLAFAERGRVTFDIDAALCLLRQLVPAVAMLHEHAPDVAHGALAPERLIVTPGRASCSSSTPWDRRSSSCATRRTGTGKTFGSRCRARRAWRNSTSAPTSRSSASPRCR